MQDNKRGFFGIGMENSKSKVNYGTLFRSAYNFDASFTFLIGERYKKQSSNTVKSVRHIPLYQYNTTNDFLKNIPYDCQLIGIEITRNAKNIINFIHPQRAIYILGPEDGDLSKEIQKRCQSIIYIPSNRCLNVAVAGSIVMYDRYMKNINKDL